VNENDLKDIFSSHSWEIHSDSIAVKHTDKSTFLHHGTGIPLDIKPFFSIEKIKEGEKVFISLLHNFIEYDAYFVIANNRTRLFWKSDFSDLLYSIFPKWHNIFKNDTPHIEKSPTIRFKKISPVNKSYEIVFIDPSSIEQDIRSENLEEFEPRKDGSVKEYYGKRYERIPANRQKAIEIHGTNCAVCGFNFIEFYGERGEGFIEIHHTKPLYLAEEAQAPNPNTDLLPVCSNCHRMIHRRSDDVLTIEELSNLIKNHK
jgi:5-methylcytosine-specific restriction enzyme A